MRFSRCVDDGSADDAKEWPPPDVTLVLRLWRNLDSTTPRGRLVVIPTMKDTVATGVRNILRMVEKAATEWAQADVTPPHADDDRDEPVTDP